MQNKIKWGRLKRIAQKISGKNVDIYGSTRMSPEIRSAVEFNGGRADIGINLKQVKNVQEVIEALAHELAHVVLGDSAHTEEHKKKWRELTDKIKVKYEEEE